MVAPVRPLIHFLDDPLERPDPLVEPLHEPLRSAFVPYASGLLMNEMKSYMEWMAVRGDFSWMNEEWEYVEDLYSYWPFLENSAGVAIDRYYFAYHPSVVCALIRVSDNSFFPEGVVVLDGPPDIALAEQLETRFPDKNVTRLNMSLVPLELIDVSEDVVPSVLYFWVEALKTLDWSTPRHRIDTMVFWANSVRDLLNQLIPVEDQTTSIEGESYVPSMQDMLKSRGLVFDVPTYSDPLASSSFLADLRQRVPDLPAEATIQDISLFFRSGIYSPRLGTDPGMYYKLNAILCMYPDDIQERLASGVVTSLDPRDAGKIGAGYSYGRAPSREGQVLLTYEELRQPRP